MSKFWEVMRAAAIGTAALVIGAPLSAAEEYGYQSPAPKQTLAEGASIRTKYAASPTATRMRNRAAIAHMDRPAPTKQHRLILQVNTNDAAAMNLALNNAMNVTQYYTDVGEKVKIEVIAFGPGLHMLREDTSPVKARIETMALSAPEVSFKACGNTQENMRKAENKDIPIIPQAQVVKSGVVRVMQLEEQGWTYVKP